MTKKMETKVYSPILTLVHHIVELDCPNSTRTYTYRELESSRWEDCSGLVEFLGPKLELIWGNYKNNHLYSYIQLNTSINHFSSLLPCLVLTKDMYPIRQQDKEEGVEYVLSELRKIISPYCKKKGDTYIVRYPCQEGSCIDIESYWTEHPSDPDVLECVRLTATIQKDKINKEVSSLTVLGHILESSPYLIALRTMLSEEKTMMKFAGIHLSDYKTKVSMPVNNNGIYVADLFLTRDDGPELVPIKFESELELPELLKLISKDHDN